MTSHKKAPTGMYTAQEAMKVIGVPSNTFYGLVDNGTIRKVVFPGRKEGFYPRQQVDNYVREIKAISESYVSEKLDFGLALAEDLPSVFELVASVSGGPNHAVPQEVLKAWIRKNPQSIHVLRRQNEVVGYVSGFILPMTTLLKRLDGTLLNREIPIDDIQPFDENDSVPFYVAEMAVKHSQKSIERGNPVPDGQLGQSLLKHTANFILVDLKKQGVIVNELYAVGQSEFGINMCRKLGMHTMSLAKGVRTDRMPCKASASEILELPLLNYMVNRPKVA
jgi:hypothetical protein